MAPKAKAKKEAAKVVEAAAEEAAEVVEEAAAVEPATVTVDVTIEELPGGGTREFPTSKRRYS